MMSYLKYISLSLIGLSSLNSEGQSLTPLVIASSGNFYSNTHGSLSFTVGELAMVETFSANSYILTQGFQQPISNLVTAIIVPGLPDLHLKVFPNPGNGSVYLSVDVPYAVHISGSLYDGSGKEVFQLNDFRFTGSQRQLYNWRNHPNGIYLLKLVIRKVAGNKMEMITQKIIITR